MITIGTGRFKAVIDQQGAELKSLIDTHNGREYLWSGDPAWWNGTAPILFPVIGGLHGGAYRFKGKEYRLPSHGFARQSRFRLIDQTPDDAQFDLMAQDKLKAHYPFSFHLLVSFHMEYSGISVRYEVRNIGSSRMYFSIGSHPAFRLPFAGGPLEHYYVEFAVPERDERYLFLDGCMSHDTEPVYTNSRHINLSRNMFDRGPVILRDVASRAVTIRKSRSMHAVTVHFDTPHLAIWSKPKGAPFLCIEPWHGLPDPVGFTGSIEDKPGITALDFRDSFTSSYRIEITDHDTL